jgi:hypothetical protein
MEALENIGLLEEVYAISSVSGGSLTNGYYALNPPDGSPSYWARSFEILGQQKQGSESTFRKGGQVHFSRNGSQVRLTKSQSTPPHDCAVPSREDHASHTQHGA